MVDDGDDWWLVMSMIDSRWCQWLMVGDVNDWWLMLALIDGWCWWWLMIDDGDDWWLVVMINDGDDKKGDGDDGVMKIVLIDDGTVFFLGVKQNKHSGPLFWCLFVVECHRKAFGESNVQTAKHYGNLGRLYQSMRRYKVNYVISYSW